MHTRQPPPRQPSPRAARLPLQHTCTSRTQVGLGIEALYNGKAAVSTGLSKLSASGNAASFPVNANSSRTFSSVKRVLSAAAGPVAGFALALMRILLRGVEAAFGVLPPDFVPPPALPGDLAFPLPLPLVATCLPVRVPLAVMVIVGRLPLAAILMVGRLPLPEAAEAAEPPAPEVAARGVGVAAFLVRAEEDDGVRGLGFGDAAAALAGDNSPPGDPVVRCRVRLQAVRPGEHEGRWRWQQKTATAPTLTVAKTSRAASPGAHSAGSRLPSPPPRT